jgi:hypothetical protein
MNRIIIILLQTWVFAMRRQYSSSSLNPARRGQRVNTGAYKLVGTYDDH